MSEPTAHIGPYQLIERLGQGGMGVVYRARHTVTGQMAALKTVRLADETLLQSLRREIHALARLSHPGIVRIVDQGVQTGLPWYAMEFVQGPTLRQHLRKTVVVEEATSALELTGSHPTNSLNTHSAPLPTDRYVEGTRVVGPSREWTDPSSNPIGPYGPPGPPPPARLRASERKPLDLAELRLALQPVQWLCATLAFLHGEGLVHRDLKPDNILMTQLKGLSWPVLVDFGLAATFRGDRGREELGPAGLTVGTAAYMAPEQVRGELVDARADLYALGCILYEIVTGSLPFNGPSLKKVLWKHITETPVAPSQLVEGVPPRLESLILRLMEKQPRHRLGHADDIAVALMELTEAPAFPPGLPKPRAYLYRPGFTGRTREMALLEEKLQPLASGLGDLVRIAGESGAGKTRLMLELERKAGELGILVLVGQTPAPLPRVLDAKQPGSPTAVGPGALHPLREPLRQIADRCRARGPQETEQLLGSRTVVLAPYEPVLWGLPGQETQPAASETASALPADAARLRLYAALTETFQALASSQPVLLALDDLQWADELTLGWLAFLLRTQSLQETALLLLGAYRTDDAGTAGLSVLQDSPRSNPPILLGRLEQAEVGAMAAEMLSLPEAPEALTRFLAHESEGNPLFVAEWLHAVVAEGFLQRDGEGHWQLAPAVAPRVSRYEDLSLPGSLLELVQRRLEGLSPEALELVSAAAVLGREMSQARLLRLGATRGLEPLDALEELVRRQILEEPRTEAVDRLRFAHDKLREAAYGRLGVDSRKSLHHAAAQVITQEYGQQPLQEWDEDLEALGRHWEEAGLPRQAKDCYQTGGNRATARYAQAEAERLFRAFLRLEQPPEPAGIRVRCALASDVLSVDGRTEEALQVLRTGFDQARMLGDRMLEGQCLQQSALVQFLVAQDDQSRDFYQQSLEVFAEIGNLTGQACSLRNLGVLDEFAGDIEKARLRFAEALRLAREAGSPKEEAAVLGDLGVLESKQGRFDEACALTEQALAVSRSIGDRLTEAANLGNLSIQYRRQGRLREACALAEESARLCKATGHLRSEAIISGNLGNLLVDLGRFQEARPLYRRARAVCRQVGDVRTEVYVLLFHAALERRTADQYDEAILLLEQAEQIRLSQQKERPLAIISLCERGHLALAQGKRPEAEASELAQITAQWSVGHQSAEGRAIDRFQRALAAHDQGRPLVRGECLEDLPEALRQPQATAGGPIGVAS